MQCGKTYEIPSVRLLACVHYQVCCWADSQRWQHVAAGPDSGCHMTRVSSFPTALELCPSRGMHGSENDVLNLGWSVDSKCFVFVVQEIAVVVGIPYVCYEEVY